MSRAWKTRGAVQGEISTLVDKAELHRSIVQNIAQGLRDGIDGQALDGYRSVESAGALVMLNSRQLRAEQLAGEVAEQRRLATRARRLAESETDDDLAQGMLDDARAYARRGRELEARRLELLAATDGEAPAAFTTEAGYLLQGLSALITDDNVVSQKQAAALRKVITGFRLELSGDRVRWSLSLLVSAAGRVIEIGPFSGAVRARGRRRPPAEATVTRAATDLRRDTLLRLQAAGLGEALARAATLAPTQDLARVLLGEDIRWEGLTEPEAKAFNTYLRGIWFATASWSAKVYAWTSSPRQVYADIVAALGGVARADQVILIAQAFDVRPAAVHSLTLPRTSNANPFPTATPRRGRWRQGSGLDDSFLESVLCPRCGQPATAVVRTPEVPDALLCRACLVMPSRPDLRFPSLWGRLALPPTEIPAGLLREARALPAGLTRRGPQPRDRQTQVAEVAEQAS